MKLKLEKGKRGETCERRRNCPGERRGGELLAGLQLALARQ